MRGHSWNFRGLQTLGPSRAPSSNINTKITFCDRTGVKTNAVEVGCCCFFLLTLKQMKAFSWVPGSLGAPGPVPVGPGEWSGQTGTHSAVHTGHEEGLVLQSWRPGGLPESRECCPGRPGVGTAPGALDSISPSLPVRLPPCPWKLCIPGLLWDVTGGPSPSILLGALPVGPQRPAATLTSIPGRQKWPLQSSTSWPIPQRPP